MSKTEAKKRIAKLIEEVRHHRYLYHVLDKQEISDAALDSLKRELAELEKDFPSLIRSDSPTQRVGGRPLDKFIKVKHATKILSLADAFNMSDLEDWQTFDNVEIVTLEEQLRVIFDQFPTVHANRGLLGNTVGKVPNH